MTTERPKWIHVVLEFGPDGHSICKTFLYGDMEQVNVEVVRWILSTTGCGLHPDYIAKAKEVLDKVR